MSEFLPEAGAAQEAVREGQAPDEGQGRGTGDPEVDAALQALDDLSDAPLGEHHDRLAAAHERIHGALDPERAALDPDSAAGRA